MTEWRPVLGYEGLYEVSSDGHVRSLGRTLVAKDGRRMTFHPKIMKATKHPITGYLLVELVGREGKTGNRSNRQVSNIVCEAFHGPRPSGKFAAHGNGVRDDNRKSNLSWKTAKENEADKIIHGTKPVGETVGGALLNGSQVVAIRSLRAAGNTYNQIATELGVTFGCVRGVCARGAYSNVREAA